MWHRLKNATYALLEEFAGFWNSQHVTKGKTVIRAAEIISVPNNKIKNADLS